jgi:hypothetical protein
MQVPSQSVSLARGTSNPAACHPLPRAGKADKVALMAIASNETGLIYPNTRLVAGGLLPCATDEMRT